MAMYKTTSNYIVFKDKMPSKEYQEKLEIKKTNFYTKDTNKQIYKMGFLSETDARKQFDNYKYADKIKDIYNRVEKKEKRFSDEKAKNLYFEKK